MIAIQVKDADKADAGLEKIKDCGGTDDVGWAIEGDWAIVGESDDIADDVVAATKKGSLADDDDFKHVDRGRPADAGVVTLYAGPAAGDYLADHADSLFGFPLGLVTGGGTRLRRLRRPTIGTRVRRGLHRRGSRATWAASDKKGSAIADDLKARFA